MNRVMRFVTLEQRERSVLLEAYGYLLVGRVIKLLPFSSVAPALGQQMAETGFHVAHEQLETAELVARSIERMTRYTFWESACLVQAVAAMKMLKRRGVPCTLYLGTCRSEEGGMLAHAWLRVGGMIVTGGEECSRYTVVGTFAQRTERNGGG